MEQKLQDIYEYYRNETSLGQSELVITMLTELQEACGYLSKEMQQKTAEIAGVNEGYVAAIIKNLPNLHAQPFEHEIRICISDRCKARGSGEILKMLQKVLRIKPGQVTKDGKILLSVEHCMHNCIHGPNIKIDGKLYSKMDSKKVKEEIQKIITR